MPRRSQTNAPAILRAVNPAKISGKALSKMTTQSTRAQSAADVQMKRDAADGGQNRQDGAGQLCEAPHDVSAVQPDLKDCKQSLHALDALNLFMADVQTGVGPYLAIFLKTARQFDPGQVGIAMAAASVAQVALQTPAGALIDRTRRKRLLVAAAAGLTGVGALMIVFLPKLWTTVLAQILIGGAGAIFPPAVAALSLGIVGRALLTKRQSRNEAFNHTGNVLAALLFGFIGYKVAPAGIFYCVAALGVATIFAVLRIREKDIDHERARGADAASDDENKKANDDKEKKADDKNKSIGILKLFEERRMLTFAAAVVLFHSANAAMLPLVGEVLGGDANQTAALYLSACIIVAQLTMIPVALLVGRYADRIGHKPIFLVGIASIVIRGALFATSKNPYFLVSVQVLDGVGAAIFGVLNVLIIASLTRGTGRFNFAQGAIATSVGIGGGLSNLGAGFLVKHSGFKIGFLALSIVAAVAFVFYMLLMPETTVTNRKGKPSLSSQTAV
jgi:MFS family permease